MAVKVREGVDYKLLPDDYRKEFHIHNKPKKIKREIIQGKPVKVGYYRCLYCRHMIPHYELEVDHIIPKTRLKAGILWNPNKSWNLGPSCKVCNISKSNYIDGRVTIGFKNKLLEKYGMGGSAFAAGTTGQEGEVSKLKLYSLMSLVYLFSLTSPLILLTLKGLDYLVILGARLLRYLSKKLLFRLPKRVWKYFKYTVKHPLKVTKRILGGAAILTGLFLLMNYTGLTVSSIMLSIKNYITTLL